MFDFENLDVYKKAKYINKEILELISSTKKLDIILRNQLKRASISIVLNIAEGTGRFSTSDKRHFYIISRGSIYECVSLMDILKDDGYIENNQYSNFYIKYEELSKMIYGLIKSLK